MKLTPLSLIILGGCVSNATAAVTMPIWLFLGFLFLTDLKFEGIWKGLSYLSLVQIFFIAGFWYGFVTDLEVTFWVFLLPLLAFGATIVSMSLLQLDIYSKRMRVTGYLLQVFAVVGALLPMLIVYLEGQPR